MERPRHLPRSFFASHNGAGHAHRPREPRRSTFEFDGRSFLRIDDVDGLAPFFMNIVSGGDRWMYTASTGGLVMGRRSPEGALFPYETDDRLMAADGTVGARTVMFVETARGLFRWEPHLRAADGQYDVRRALWKSALGNELWHEERNLDLGLTLQSGWASGDRFGFQRRVRLINEQGHVVRVRLCDGLVSILPACVDPVTQARYSNLVDAYRQSEWLDGSGLALFRLSSIPTDQAIPNEALRANTAWVRGLPGGIVLLSKRQLAAFRRDEAVQAEQHTRAEPGALLVCADITLAPGETREWVFGLDAALDAQGVVRLQRELADHADATGMVLDAGPRARLDADLAADRERLASHVAAADGIQHTADAYEDARHLANALFNVMRGGTFLDEGRIDRADFALYLRQVAPALAARTSLTGWPERLTRQTLIDCATRAGDVDLERLAREYLPLTFSRRHGDPSRPWNHFKVATHDEHGRPRLDYQGNWRDIFQNWEALLRSYPEYSEAVVVKFLNATTIDGFNPYRIAREGVDWEVPDAADPWAHIGYWGDHQVIYLQRLLDWSERVEPGALTALLRRAIFVYTDVPYRLASYERIVADPYATITFDHARDHEIAARAAQLGNEARLRSVHADPTALWYATLAEKLLVPILSKLSHFVPGVGFWMNTQRPEWNDANNALVGDGVSVVTAAYLCRHIVTVRELFAKAGPEPLAVHPLVARHLRETAAILTQHAKVREHGSDRDRRRVLDALGTAGSRYRASVYADVTGSEPEHVDPVNVLDFLASAATWLAATVRANVREDGLVHAYNLMRLTDDGGLEVRRLPPMLEGQVAASMSNALDAAQIVDLLDALRQSPLRRADLGTYLLYPDREPPSFLQKAVITAEDVAASPLLRALIAAADRSVVRVDANGTARFAPDLRNAEQLDAALRSVALDPRFSALAASGADHVREVYERVFDHRSFTGRSGSFFGYEGIGCVYWHMVSKLRLAVIETWRAARERRDDALIVARLASHYADIRNGLGVGATPAEYGAFPSDPYSHTPAHAGARQPGMTGQVKEDLIARLVELGVHVAAGQLTFERPWISARDLSTTAVTLRLGREPAVQVPAGSVAFSIAGVPVILRAGDTDRVVLVLNDDREAGGREETVRGGQLGLARTRELFERRGTIRRIDLFARFDEPGA